VIKITTKFGIEVVQVSGLLQAGQRLG